MVEQYGSLIILCLKISFSVLTLFINDLLVVRHSSYRDFWETLKENIKTYIVSYSKHKRRDASRQKVFLTNRLIYLKNLLACGLR